jgi:class 3 adenylate cyclase
MGLHSAEPYADDEGYVGVGVHRAARICAAGHGGQILLSNATAGIVEDLAIAGVELEDLGEHRLKDIARPQRLFQLNVEGLETEFPPLKSLDLPAPGAVSTLLFCDVAFWAGLLRELGDERMGVVTRAYQTLARREIERHDGRVFELIADNIVAGFDRPLDAVRAARDFREALRSEPWSSRDEPPAACMAVHSGVSPTHARATSARPPFAVRCSAGAPSLGRSSSRMRPRRSWRERRPTSACAISASGR